MRKWDSESGQQSTESLLTCTVTHQVARTEKPNLIRNKLQTASACIVAEMDGTPLKFVIEDSHNTATYTSLPVDLVESGQARQVNDADGMDVMESMKMSALWHNEMT